MVQTVQYAAGIPIIRGSHPPGYGRPHFERHRGYYGRRDYRHGYRHGYNRHGYNRHGYYRHGYRRY